MDTDRSVRDEVEIQALLAEYSLRLEVDEFEHWLELFTVDCEYEIFRRTLRGREEIRAMLSQAPPGVHLGGHARIHLAGDQAQTLQNYVFVDRASRDVVTGWYHATVARTAAGWRIRRFRIQIDK